jgi:hypothetical protein
MNGKIIFRRSGGLGEFEIGFVFGAERREVIDLNSVGVDDGESGATGGEGEVLACALDRRAVGVEELLAGAGLVYDHGL